MKFPSTVPGDHALILQATRFATLAHDGQRRKYTDEPYIVHPLTVAARVAQRTMDPHVIAAAVLHDVLEDTPTTYRQLADLFSGRVAELVRQLTDFYTHEAFPDLNREERKRREAERFGLSDADAQLIKVYDLLDNTETIVTRDPGFAKVYLREKRRMLGHMTKIDPHEKLLLKDFLSE